MEKPEYHTRSTCNKCGGINKETVKDSGNGVVYESETMCTVCGFVDFWAYGFFMSAEDGFNECRKY